MSRELAGDRLYLYEGVSVDEDRSAFVRRSAVVDLVRKLWSELTDEQRLDIITDTCRGCGTLDPKCQCWNDE